MLSPLPQVPSTKRWPYLPAQGLALASAVMVFLGTALPWARVLGDSLWGSAGALTWTLSGGCLVLASAIVRRRGLAAGSALAGGAIAVYFGVWQTARIFERCGLTLDCLPGPGLGFVLAGGLGAGYVGARLLLTYASHA
jgi:hypothetical protein